MSADIEILRPQDRDAWLKLRGRDVTASVVGALFDVHEYVTRYELWASKTGRVAATSDETPAMARGRLLEPVAVQMLREQYPGWTIEHSSAGPGVYYRDPALRLGGTPDVIATDPQRGRGVVQIKSVEAGVFRRKWHDNAGDLEPPFWIALQATLEAYLTGSSWAAAAALVVGYGVELHVVDVPLVDGVVDAMGERSREFWQMIAEGREPVPDYDRDAALIDKLYADGDPESEADLTTDNRLPELLAARSEAARAVKTAKAEIAAIDAEIKSKMGDATVAHIEGGRRITWKRQTRAATYVPASSFRVLRLPTERKQPDE